jgi:hypothetical protein
VKEEVVLWDEKISEISFLKNSSFLIRDTGGGAGDEYIS